MLAQLKEDFPDDFRYVYRHFPLHSIHDKALLSTQASEAAGLQGRFWEMHDVLYERQSEWSPLEIDQFKEWLAERAEEIGMDVQQFADDLMSEAIIALAENAWNDGVEIGLPGTPFLLVNGQYYGGPRDYGNLSALVKLVLLKDRQFTECPPLVIDPERQYVATIQTEKGDIRVELFTDVAPLAVNSFVFLARQGWFDGVIFHRVLPGFVAQTGDPTGTGFGGPGYAFENEISPDYTFDKAGVLGMANSGPDTNGSQFFITLGAAPHLNGDFTVFGQVLDGMEVVESLTPRNPAQSVDLPPGDRILSISIEER